MPNTRTQEKDEKQESEDGRGSNAQDQPRDEQGRFVSKDDVDESSNNKGQSGKGSRGSSGKDEDESSNTKGQGGKGSHGSTGGSKGKDDQGDSHSKGKGHQGSRAKGKGDADGDEEDDSGMSEAREKMVEAAREFAKERPRDEQGRFLSDEEAGAA